MELIRLADARDLARIKRHISETILDDVRPYLQDAQPANEPLIQRLLCKPCEIIEIARKLCTSIPASFSASISSTRMSGVGGSVKG